MYVCIDMYVCMYVKSVAVKTSCTAYIHGPRPQKKLSDNGQYIFLQFKLSRITAQVKTIKGAHLLLRLRLYFSYVLFILQFNCHILISV